MKRSFKRSIKKAISMVLVSVMLLSTLPLNVLAQELNHPDGREQVVAANALVQGLNNPNTRDQVIAELTDKYGTEAAAAMVEAIDQGLYNQNAKEQLIAQLSEQYGAETADEMVESMISMGIIDENGNRLTYKIEMDDQLYTLDQMRDIVNAPNVDLAKEVKVDNQVVTLAYIAKLIDFETYMEFVEENFLKNNVKVTDEHFKMLADLENQLKTEGISIVEDTPESAITETAIPEPDAAAEAMFSAAAVAPVNVVTCSAELHNGKQVIVNYQATGGEYYHAKASFSQEYLPGIFGEPRLLDPITLDATNGGFKSISFYLSNLPSQRWNGSANVGYMRLTNLDGYLFSNGKSSQLVPITLAKTYDYTQYSLPTTNIFPTNMNAVGKIFLERQLNQSFVGLVGPGPFPLKKVPSGTRFTIDYGAYEFQNYLFDGELLMGVNLTMPESVKNAFLDNAASKLTFTAAINATYSLSTNYDSATYKFTDQFPKNASGVFTPVKIDQQTLPAVVPINLSEADRQLIAHGDALWLTFRAPSTTRQFYLRGDINYGDDRLYARALDDEYPTVKEISSPNENYKAGEQVPIVVTFSEPIVQKNQLTLTMKDDKNREYTAKSVYNSTNPLTHSKVTFLYDIPPQTSEILWPVKISGNIYDTSNKIVAVYTFPSNAERLATTFNYNEIDSITGIALQHADGTALTGTYSAGEIKGKLEVNLFQNPEVVEGNLTVGKKQNNWLISYTDEVEAKFKVQRLYASTNGGITKIPLYITDEVDKLTAEFDLPANSGDYKMLFYMATDEAPTVFRPILEANKSVQFTKAPLILVTAAQMTINHPVSKILNLGDEQIAKLEYTYSGNATYQSAEDFKWVSNNPAIAKIDPTTGEITPLAVGKVTFKLVAMNGTTNVAQHVSKTSEEFTVKVYLGKPSLAVSKFITTKQGMPVQVMWSTNVIYINQQAEPKKNTSFTVDLYEGNYANVAALAGKTPSYTANSAVNANSITIPGEQLTLLSSGKVPAYTVKISTESPYVSGEKVETVGNIIVGSPPANVKIVRPASYYMLDTAQSLTVDWSSTNVNNTPGGHDFAFAVTKNGASVTTNQAASGSYTLDFADVTGKLKDVYTVTAKIKNTDDDAYSYDSFVLHVYDGEAMKIWVDKHDASSIIMDNEGRISGMSSEAIVALERNIALTNKLSINYGDYSYGLVTDQVEWKSSDSQVSSINYSQGGGYNNIEDYDFPSYMPDANFILAGLKDGTATINATHKLSRMTDILGVEVKTLKDKLYLFQAMPMATTEFIYTNGDNEKKTVNSDAKGAVAIYEPKGIKGNVLLKSIVGDSIYMGTIYEVNLLSSENDGSKGQLYPINNFVLRKAAQLDLNFKKLDGTPYTGTVTIRGGVYKNGNYCEASEISDNVGAWKEPDLITPAKGFHRHGFDVNNFWSQEAGETSASSVVATDIIDYVFEFHFENDDYLPQIMKFSGNLSGADVLRFGESIVTLEATAEKNKPFFSTQHLDRFKKSGRLDSIKNATGNIGLNAQTPKVRIDTQALWWGAPLEDTNGAISILNEKGVALAGQNYKTYKYPFATMLLTEHQMMIDESNIWIGKKGRGKLTVKLFNEDGSLYNSTLQAYSIRNMLPVENISASPEVNANFQAEMQKSIKAGTSFDASDKFTQSALDFVSGIQFGNDNFSLMLAPTADPTVFKGLLQLTVGDDVMDMGPEENGFSLMLDDDEVSTNGKGKAAFAKSRELVSGLKDDIDSIMDDSGGSSVKYQVGGYFSCKIIYNFDEDKWEIRPIGGGIRAGISYEFSRSDTTWAGPVPCTYEIALGAAVRLEFDAHMLYEPVSVEYSDETIIDYWWQEDKESATDYLTNLRIKAYIYAFGGLGIDYTIIALKVGVFGQLVLENENKFLNRNYLDEELATEKALSGSRLSLAGQVGIKFVAKLLFISYQATLASAQFEKEWVYRNWDKIEQYWEETTGDMLTMQNMRMAAQSYAAATGQDAVVITEAPALESRGYLDDYARVWSTPSGKMSVMSLDIDNLAPSTLQSNAYPYANPLIADDGTMFVYLSDNGSPEVWDTTANYAVKESGIYVEKGKINTEESFGDSQLSFASNNSQAISAWVRLTEKLTKNAGDTLTAPEMAMMINNTEVYASIYKGSGWTTERLTSNSTPDMAPAVATNGSQAIVAWRSVYAGDASNPTDFSGKDTIVYRIFNGTQWSEETKTLYNGVNGSVLGLKAAMNADGTAAIAYVIDTSGTRDANSYEIVYGVVGSNAEIVNNVRLTNDTTADQNPQLTVAKFGDALNPDERFVLGWYNLDGEKADIRLATFGNDGSPKEDFIDSLSSVSSGNNVGGNFKFVNTSTANKDFKNLSILWVEPNASTGSDSLKAIKFVQETVDETELTFTSAAVDVAEMPAKTIIDSFDAYVSNAAIDEVKVVILGTETKNEFDTITSDGNTIMVPKTESKMFTATETYQNKAKITAADFNFTEIMAGFIMPIAFTVQNQGKDLITSVTIEYGTESKTFNNLKILPGTSNTLLVNYGVPANIVDLAYSGTATFGNSTIDMTGNGTLPLTVADLGISKISTVKEQDGQREFAVTLYNSSDYKLNTSGKTVKLGIYVSSAYTPGTEVVPMVTISDADELFLIDNGAYMTNLSFDIKTYLSGIGKNEIPANGVTLYAKAWVVDNLDKELAEFVGENNFSTILCENLVQRNGGNAIKVDVKQSNSATETTAVLTLQNLAMTAVTNGNVAVNLLDEGGNIIKTQYLSNTKEDLVALGSEAVINKTFVFDTLGADVEAYYFNATADSMNADLQLLAASGVGVGFDKDTTTYDNLKVSGLESTNITAISANPNAKVVLKDASNTVLKEETGALAYTLPLATGSNTFKVTVEPNGLGAQPKTYALTVENAAPGSGSVTLATSVLDTRGWWNSDSVPVALTTTELANFTPTKMQYKVNNGDWTDKDYTSSPIEVTNITAEGTHVINAKLQDVFGYNLTANSLTVKMDRTAPTFVPEKTLATLAGNTVTVSADVYDALNSIYNVVLTRDSVTYAMQKQADTDTYTANITASRIGAITIFATDMAGNTAQIATGIPDGVLASITTPTAIAGIAYGTAKTAIALGLPPTVTMVTDQGEVNASVTWAVYTSGYDVAITTEQTFTVDGTVTLPEGVKNTDNVALTTSIGVTVKGAAVVASITTPTAIAGIAYGTAKTAEALGLPPTVTMVTDQGEVNASVTWAVYASGYDVATTTEQTFTVDGTVTLPEGVKNTDNVALTTSIGVTVNEAVVLASITTPTAIAGIAYGTAKTAEALGLPSTVTMVTNQGNLNASVTWDVDVSSYDVATTTEQTFTVVGTVTLPEGVVNTDNLDLTTSIGVTVKGTAVLESITMPTAIAGIANGTAKTAAVLGLPTTVTMVTDQGNVNASVTWDVDNSSYDVATTTEQTFTVNGTITLPEGVVNTSNVALTTSIGITVKGMAVLESITTHEAIAGIANGAAKTAEALGLPTTITMVTDQGNVSASVTWDVYNSSYDVATTTEQSFTVQGAVYLPGGVVNTDNVELITTIDVTVSAYATTRGGGGSADVTKTDIIKTMDSTNKVRLTAAEVNKAKTLTVNGDGVNLIFSEDILTEMKIKSSMEATIKAVKAEELSEEARAIVGDRPVFDIKVIADGKPISNGKLYIELPYTPKEGEDTSKLAAFYIADDGTITQMAGSRYDSVKKAIVFTTTHLSVYAVGEIKDVLADVKFADVVEGSWAISYIYYLAERNIINGKTETTFAPNDNITRAEFVTILAKMSGNTLPAGTDEFNDAPPNAWYAQYVAWASKMDIAKGYEGNFKPNSVITRQDMAAMIARYAENVANYALPESNETNTFADDTEIAGYAKDAVYAMQQAGIISGRGGNTFAPAANASRAEAAKMIAILMQGMSK